jgi:hypothetical protein
VLGSVAVGRRFERQSDLELFSSAKNINKLLGNQPINRSEILKCLVNKYIVALQKYRGLKYL